MSDAIYFSPEEANAEIRALGLDSWSEDTRTCELYLVISHLALMAGVENDPQVIRALDLAAYGFTKNNASLIPFDPRK